jgi:hypothetical protein
MPTQTCGTCQAWEACDCNKSLGNCLISVSLGYPLSEHNLTAKTCGETCLNWSAKLDADCPCIPHTFEGAIPRCTRCGSYDQREIYVKRLELLLSNAVGEKAQTDERIAEVLEESAENTDKVIAISKAIDDYRQTTATAENTLEHIGRVLSEDIEKTFWYHQAPKCPLCGEPLFSEDPPVTVAATPTRIVLTQCSKCLKSYIVHLVLNITGEVDWISLHTEREFKSAR